MLGLLHRLPIVLLRRCHAVLQRSTVVPLGFPLVQDSFPAGQLPGGLALTVRQSHGRQSLCSRRPAQSRGHQAEIGDRIQVLAQPVLLEHRAQAQALQARDGPPVRRLQSHEDPQQGGLARTGGGRESGALSRRQSDLAAVKRTVRRCVGLGAYLLCPLLTGFAVIAKAFVLAVLTEKWLDAVPFIIIFCLAYMTRPLESTCHQALLALGKSGLVFRIMVLINTGSLIGVVIAAFLLRSVLWIALCSLITTVISLGCFFAAARHHFDYRLREQAQDLFLPVAMSAV